MVYTFDDLGRTTAENWFATAASTSQVNTLTWTYEASTGRLTGSGDAGVAGDTYVYDSLGRIQTATRTLDGLSVPFTYVPSYSQRDERLGLNIFYGQVITGPLADPILYGQSALFDALGQPTQLSLAAYGGGPAQQANFSYDLAGQTTKIQRTQGSVVATESRLAYDNQGRLASLQHVQTGIGFARQTARYDQAYDAVNRITRIDSSVDEASVYNYDKTGQLLTAQMTFENNEAYTYDANGNRTSGGTQSAGAHKNLVTQDAKYTYLYDGENNRIRRTERATGNYQLYTWDHRNRLTKVEFVNTSGVTVRAIEYRYDANDQKVTEFVDTTAPFDMANASAKWFIYDGGNVVLDFARADMSQAPGATISKRYFQGLGVDQLLAQENIAGNASQSVWWILPDHLGSTRDLVTASGSVIAHFQFDSFGNILDGRENVTRYQFTGREHDSNTDLNYHRARWYDPFSGKWLSEDPIGFAAGDANVTRYVGNGVLNGTDPSGLWWQYPPSTAGNPNPPPTWIPDAPEDPPYGTPKPSPRIGPSNFDPTSSPGYNYQPLPLHAYMSELRWYLRSIAGDNTEAQAEADRIARAISNTWRFNSFPDIKPNLRRWPNHRAKGYYCYQWARAFKQSFDIASSGKHFSAKIESATLEDQNRNSIGGHYWLRIDSQCEPGSVFVDDGFAYPEGWNVHLIQPIPNGYFRSPGTDGVFNEHPYWPSPYDPEGRSHRPDHYPNPGPTALPGY